MVIEKLLQLFVCKIDTKLLEAVELEISGVEKGKNTKSYEKLFPQVEHNPRGKLWLILINILCHIKDLGKEHTVQRG